MATAKTKESGGNEALKQIHYLAGALKAPRITDAAGRICPRRRLDPRGVPRRGAGSRGRRPQCVRCPPADPCRRVCCPQDAEEFDWDAQPAARQQIAALASGAS